MDQWSGGVMKLNVTNFLRKQRQKNGGQKNDPQADQICHDFAQRNVYGFSVLHVEHFFDDTKPHVSVFHFSVLAFVQANLTLSSSNKAFNNFAPNRFAFLKS